MVPALVLALVAGPVTADPPKSQVLTPAAACKLALEDATTEGRTYTLKGVYNGDWEYGATLQPDGCNEVFLADIDGDAEARVTRYKQAFRQTCHATMMDTYISGELTGVFVRDKSDSRFSAGGQTMTIRYSRFIVTDFKSADYDLATMSCPKPSAPA